MNNDIVNNETDLLCYRLRTKRQRKRAAKEGFDRKLRALDRELNRLWQKRRNLGLIELKPPVMRGWERFFVLRADVAESIYADFFEGLLGKINTTWRSNRQDFKRRKKRVKKWKYEAGKQELQPLNEKSYKMLTAVEQSYFEEKVVMNQQRIWIKTYLFREPWRFVLKVQPHMVTHTRIRSEEIEKREAELNMFIEKRHLKPRLFWLKGTSYKRYYDLRQHAVDKEGRKFGNTSLQQILNSIEQD